jgi:putative ABC transport system substrate-binding protein
MNWEPIRRRSFLTLLGGAAAAWPLAARAQQPAMPVVGYLFIGSPEPIANRLTAFLKGLSDAGFSEGRNVAIEYRYAHDDINRVPELAADLIRRRVTVIAALGSTPAALAVKAATATIPIVFAAGGDPVEYGLVASLNRPGGNVTGLTDMSVELLPKLLGLLRELVPQVARFGLLTNPKNPVAGSIVKDAQSAELSIGRPIEFLTASTNGEIDAAFASLAPRQVDALVIAPDTLFSNRRSQLATLATHYRVPASYWTREYPEVGGLMSYGASVTDRDRQAGIYTGRILKGEKPANLPVMRPTKFELVINLHTARTLGLTVPPTLLALADEVIE